MKWIKSIKEINDYTVTCLWNDGVVRKIDLTEFIMEKAKNPENSYAQLADKKRFAEVKCDGSTLYWEKGLEFKDYDGKIKKGPLDIAHEVLFELTVAGKRIRPERNTINHE
ncbi:MAG: hypothetical protein WD077_04075 [Bacteroidia bacterium]